MDLPQNILNETKKIDDLSVSLDELQDDDDLAMRLDDDVIICLSNSQPTNGHFIMLVKWNLMSHIF